MQEHLVEWSGITSLSANYRTGVGYTPEEANYALKLSSGTLNQITHNRFVVPEWGTLRFNLHTPNLRNAANSDTLRVSISEGGHNWQPLG